jgi:predicted nuclease of predicted toxin-antitoxin system
MEMNSIRLLLDEDVWRGLAIVLREAGYDAVSINDLDRKGYDDEAQMAFAIAENRVMFTHNIRDFAPLAQQLAEQQVNHESPRHHRRPPV